MRFTSAVRPVPMSIFSPHDISGPLLLLELLFVDSFRVLDGRLSGIGRQCMSAVLSQWDSFEDVE